MALSNEDKKKFRVQGNGKMVFELFPQEYIDLDAELRTGLHPKITFITNYGPDEIDIKMAQIAAYCEVMLDGDYSLENRIQLAGILTKKLKEKREYPHAQTIILPSSAVKVIGEA